MKKIDEVNRSIRLKLTDDEAKNICRRKQGENQCAFLAKINNGFQCIKMLEPDNKQVFMRLDAGTSKAIGVGGWPGCPWEIML